MENAMADMFVIESIHGTTVSSFENSGMQPKYITMCSHKMLLRLFPLIAPAKKTEIHEKNILKTKQMMTWT